MCTPCTSFQWGLAIVEQDQGDLTDRLPRLDHGVVSDKGGSETRWMVIMSVSVYGEFEDLGYDRCDC